MRRVDGWRSCGAETLAELANDPKSRARAAVAANAATPPTVLAALAVDPDPVVRSAVAEHPSASAAVLQTLVERTRRSSSANPVRCSAAAHRNASERTLRTLVGDLNDVVRETVAANPGCGSGMVAELAVSDDPLLRRGAARNPACPPLVLRRSISDLDGRVRAAAVQAFSGVGPSTER